LFIVALYLAIGVLIVYASSNILALSTSISVDIYGAEVELSLAGMTELFDCFSTPFRFDESADVSGERTQLAASR